MTADEPQRESSGSASPRLVRFQVKTEAPLKRWAFDPSERQDPNDEAINNALHWSYCTRLQIARFTRSLRRELGAVGDKGRVLQRRLGSATDYDEHSVLVAARNLERALSTFPRPLQRQVQMPAVPRQALRVLRDIYEHWPEARTRGGRHTKSARAVSKLREQFPNAEPWTITFDPKNGDVTIASVVSLTPLTKELRHFEARLLRLENLLRRGRVNRDV